LRAQLADLDEQTAEPSFWDDPNAAQKFLKQKKQLEVLLASYDAPSQPLEDAMVLVELGEEGEDTSVCDEIVSSFEEIEIQLTKLEINRMLGGPQDGSNAIVHINAGAGGTESLDWAGMLFRMYLRYCDLKEWKPTIIDQQEGDEAGYKSVTMSIEGQYAYGMLKAENGIHRLVRISPFDAGARRHTTFASVAVYPEVADDIDIEINESDLKVDTYRAGGAGGQHVNKTDSAVRITHIPTGIVAQCQNERSQTKNRSIAMKVLKSRLYDLELKKREEEASAMRAEKKDISFGSQIRSYVLHPYRMVKDHRTNHEVGNVDRILDGDLDEFIEAYLLKRDD
jgi:peptide chain release factor 2